MTPLEIWRSAKTLAPKIRLRDVWLILGEMRARGVATCLNPGEHNGKVYVRADIVPKSSDGTDWHAFAVIYRSRVRHQVLIALMKRSPQTTTAVRKTVNERYPHGLASTVRAMQGLRQLGLVTVCGEGAKRGQKLYAVTAKGRRLMELFANRTRRAQTFLNAVPMESV
ncbi:MAG: hypothetical protein K1Y02_06195 [Candidatus Hydrogenedentes bacterium]|nr:hypothetical protein [Candidatus Hydrogenedentota bacterium]